ncbi:MAG: hypothetical protein RL385_3701, partial [Pseudomonadota bacterium]
MRDTRIGRAAILLTLGVAAACGRGDKAAEGTTTAEQRRTEPQPIAAKACEAGEASTVDVNGDGRADIVQRSQGGRALCSLIDLNFDGR